MMTGSAYFVDSCPRNPVQIRPPPARSPYHTLPQHFPLGIDDSALFKQLDVFLPCCPLADCIELTFHPFLTILLQYHNRSFSSLFLSPIVYCHRLAAFRAYGLFPVFPSFLSPAAAAAGSAAVCRPVFPFFDKQDMIWEDLLVQPLFRLFRDAWYLIHLLPDSFHFPLVRPLLFLTAQLSLIIVQAPCVQKILCPFPVLFRCPSLFISHIVIITFGRSLILAKPGHILQPAGIPLTIYPGVMVFFVCKVPPPQPAPVKKAYLYRLFSPCGYNLAYSPLLLSDRIPAWRTGWFLTTATVSSLRASHVVVCNDLFCPCHSRDP